MPSRKGYEQAVTWLKSKMAEGDTLDAINAEVCYHVILDLKKRRQAIGALYKQTRDQNQRLIEKEEQRAFVYKELRTMIDTMYKPAKKEGTDIPETEKDGKASGLRNDGKLDGRNP